MAGPTKAQLQETLAALQEKLADTLEDRRVRTDALLLAQDQAADARHWLAYHASFGDRASTIAYALGRLSGTQAELPCPCRGAK